MFLIDFFFLKNITNLPLTASSIPYKFNYTLHGLTFFLSTDLYLQYACELNTLLKSELHSLANYVLQQITPFLNNLRDDDLKRLTELNVLFTFFVEEREKL